jgi:hypothetical protein
MKYEESTDEGERLKFFKDGTSTIIRYSPLTGKFNKATMILNEEQYNRWRHHGDLIQNAMPHLDNEEREFIMSGYTPEDWAAMFPPDEEEE